MRYTSHGWLLFGFLAFFSFSPALAGQIPHPGTFREKKWPNPAGHCGLSRFAIENYEYDYVGSPSDPGVSRGTTMASVVETSDPSCLRDYGIVQYIRGCLYNVRYDRAKNRITDRYFGLVRDQRGRTIPFTYEDWDVDTVDADPLYQSDESGNPADRLNLYRYSKRPLELKDDPRAIEKDGKTFFDSKSYGFLPDGGKNLKQYFVSDLPTFADWLPDAGAGEEEWINASLEFETCVYRSKDIPLTGTPLPPGTPESSGGPLACFKWSHKQVFDPLKKAFQAPTAAGIDAACSELPTRRKRG